MGPGAVTKADRLAELYRAESARVVNLAYALTGDRALAEDLMQEAFLKVGSRLRRVAPDDFGAYLRTTVVNLARSHHRRTFVRRKHAGEVEHQHVTRQRIYEEGAGVSDTRDMLWRALQSLPARQREAVVCRFFMDMSEQETARTLGVGVGTVKSSVSRGLQALRGIVDVDEVQER
jgi:RNA polymerase sigma-70 factor (sigma-E family)